MLPWILYANNSSQRILAKDWISLSTTFSRKMFRNNEKRGRYKQGQSPSLKNIGSLASRPSAVGMMSGCVSMSSCRSCSLHGVSSGNRTVETLPPASMRSRLCRCLPPGVRSSRTAAMRQTHCQWPFLFFVSNVFLNFLSVSTLGLWPASWDPHCWWDAAGDTETTGTVLWENSLLRGCIGCGIQREYQHHRYQYQYEGLLVISSSGKVILRKGRLALSRVNVKWKILGDVSSWAIDKS